MEWLAGVTGAWCALRDEDMTAMSKFVTVTADEAVCSYMGVTTRAGQENEVMALAAVRALVEQVWNWSRPRAEGFALVLLGLDYEMMGSRGKFNKMSYYALTCAPGDTFRDDSWGQVADILRFRLKAVKRADGCRLLSFIIRPMTFPAGVDAAAVARA